MIGSVSVKSERQRERESPNETVDKNDVCAFSALFPPSLCGSISKEITLPGKN